MRWSFTTIVTKIGQNKFFSEVLLLEWSVCVWNLSKSRVLNERAFKDCILLKSYFLYWGTYVGRLWACLDITRIKYCSSVLRQTPWKCQPDQPIRHIPRRRQTRHVVPGLLGWMRHKCRAVSTVSCIGIILCLLRYPDKMYWCLSSNKTRYFRKKPDLSVTWFKMRESCTSISLTSSPGMTMIQP